MSDVFEPELELNQEDPVSQDSVDSADSVNTVDGPEVADDANSEEKQGLVSSFLTMGIFNAMLLLSFVFIFIATLNMLGVLRTYNEGFPFSGGFPWSTNL